MTSKLARDSIAVTALNILSQFASFALFAIIAALYGADWQTDAFFLALTIPALFYGPVVNAITSVFIPVIAECREQRPEMLGQLIGSALLYVAGFSMAAMLLMSALAPWLLQATGSGIPAAGRQMALIHTFWLLPTIASQTVIGVLAAAYNSAGRFLLPAASITLRYALTMLLVLLIHAPLGIVSLPISFTVASLLQLALIGVRWPSLGIGLKFSYRPDPMLTRSFRLTLPLIASTALIQLGTVVSRFLASWLPEGSVSVIDYASRVAMALMELLTSGVLLVTLADWSKLVAQGNRELLHSRLRQVTTMVLFLLLPVTAALLALREPLLMLLFQRGSFDRATVVLTATVMTFFVLAIPVDVVGRVYVRILLAWQATLQVGWLATLRLIVIVAASLPGMLLFGIHGLALAELVAATVITTLLIIVVEGRLRTSSATKHPMIIALLKMSACTVVCWIVMTTLQQLMNRMAPLAVLPLTGLAGMLVYLGIAWLLRVRELTWVVNLVQERRTRHLIAS